MLNHFPAKGIGIGFIAFTHIKKLRRRGQVSKTCVLDLKKC